MTGLELQILVSKSTTEPPMSQPLPTGIVLKADHCFITWGSGQSTPWNKLSIIFQIIVPCSFCFISFFSRSNADVVSTSTM